MTVTTFNPEFINSLGFDTGQDRDIGQEEIKPEKRESRSGRLTALYESAARIATSIRSKTRAGAAEAAEAEQVIAPRAAIEAYIHSEDELFRKYPKFAELLLLKMEMEDAEQACLTSEQLSITFSLMDYPIQARREELDRAGVAITIANKLLEYPELSQEAVRGLSEAVALSGRGTAFVYDNDLKPDQATRERIADLDVFTIIQRLEARIGMEGLQNDKELLVDLRGLRALGEGMAVVAATTTAELAYGFKELPPKLKAVMRKLQRDSVPLAIALLKTVESAEQWIQQEAYLVSEAKARHILHDEIGAHQEEIVGALLSMPVIQEGTIDSQASLVFDGESLGAAFTKYASRMGVKLDENSLEEHMRKHPEVALGVSQLHATLSALVEQGKLQGLTNDQIYELSGAIFAASMSEDIYEVRKVADLNLLQSLRAFTLAERVEVRGPAENPLLVLHPEGTAIEILGSDRSPEQIEAARRACAQLVVNNLRKLTYPGRIRSAASLNNLNTAVPKTLSGIDFANSTRERVEKANEMETLEAVEVEG
ncbi:hypothetical protein A3A69_01090 [candidate division WWE3 bacterium RIFCSPLOWO2_01_FULL_37_15]|uniref:Uncharacterized protein n=1 Tax=candidate division WWE3 bacterium RIFCSPLOWO2_01_FULL_37_15 TaxID=1802622 RepID=A0A1F4V1C1_UNCKA|nr:MAG: hypothetical protein A3A69_01090 [candidate division WWE3 bacterium RIFCSPLOWO2_01_FULL_37_15]